MRYPDPFAVRPAVRPPSAPSWIRRGGWYGESVRESSGDGTEVRVAIELSLFNNSVTTLVTHLTSLDSVHYDTLEQLSNNRVPRAFTVMHR